jgi:WD40 repeat protein
MAQAKADAAAHTRVPSLKDLDALEEELTGLMRTANAMDILQQHSRSTLAKLFAFDNRVSGREQNLGAKFIDSLPVVADAPVPSFELRHEFEITETFRQFQTNTSAILHIAQDWSNTHILMSSLNCVMSMKLSSFEDRVPIATVKLPGPSAFCRVAAYHPSDRLAGLTKYDTIFLFDTNKGQTISTIKAHKRSITGILFSSDGTHMVTSSLDGRIFTHDLMTSKAIYDIHLHSGVSVMTANSDGSVIAAGLANGHIELFDSRTDQRSMKIEAHSGYTSAIAFNPDSSLLASGGNDRVLNLFDIRQTLASYAKFHRHLSTPLAVTFDLDGRVWDGTRLGELQAWTCDDGKSVYRDPLTWKPIYCLAYNEKRNSLIGAAGPSCVWERPMDRMVFQHKKSTSPFPNVINV